VCAGVPAYREWRLHDLHLAPSTVGNYVARLCAEGFLTESKNRVCETGRPPTVLQLNSEGGHFIGVDFEAHNIMAMAVDFSDTPLKYVHLDGAGDRSGRRYAGPGCGQLIFTLNPSRVILAGPLTLLGETLLHPLRARVEEILGTYEADRPAIVNSTMGEFNGALGAAALAVHQWRPARRTAVA